MCILEFKMEEGVSKVAEVVSIYLPQGRPLRVKEYSGSGCTSKATQKNEGNGSQGSAANSDHKEVFNIGGMVVLGDALEDRKVIEIGTVTIGTVKLCTLYVCG